VNYHTYKTLNHSITIQDIAKILGVSKSTVSRALKDHPDISVRTKTEIQKLAKALNYKPNAVAYTLRSRKSKVLGLLFPKLNYYFFPSVIAGIEEEVYRHGYGLMILHSNESFNREVRDVDLLLSQNVEGILASVSMETLSLDHFRAVKERNIPLVFFDRTPDAFPADMVSVDDITATRTAIEHLISRGRRRIAICVGNPNLLITRNRLQAYRQALADAGLSVVEDLIIKGETPEEAKHEAAKLFCMPSPPDGIMAISDLTMTGIMQAVYQHHIKVPEQLAVIGFCEEPFSTMYNPPLSVVKPMGFEIGQQAARLLFQRIQSDSQELVNPKHIKIRSDLIIRGST
jgi:DNA-binding LacI/PurR family transcriptional regulator